MAANKTRTADHLTATVTRDEDGRYGFQFSRKGRVIAMAATRYTRRAKAFETLGNLVNSIRHGEATLQDV